MKILIIIPAYNEEEAIKAVIDNIINNYPEYDYIVINDASTDNTLSNLKNRGYNYLDLPVNLGIGGGVQAGYKFAKENEYDFAIQIDGDGQHNPAYIEKTLKQFDKGSVDMVIGSRFIKKSGFQSSAARRLGINILSALIKILCGVKIYDVTSGFRVVSKRLIAFFAENYAHDYPEPEAIIAAVLNGYKINEVPVEMDARQGGTSSINTIKGLYYMIKVSLALLVCRISYSKEDGV